MLRPLHEFFVIELDVQNETDSGIITSGKPKAKAKVISVPRNEEDVKAGDFIVIDKNMPYTIVVDGTEITVISKEDVFGVIE
jgi:co-chaperonin GroES (HSP10)